MPAADPDLLAELSALAPGFRRRARTLSVRAMLCGLDADDLYQAALVAVWAVWADRSPAYSDRQRRKWLRLRGEKEMLVELRNRGHYRAARFRALMAGLELGRVVQAPHRGPNDGLSQSEKNRLDAGDPLFSRPAAEPWEVLDTPRGLLRDLARHAAPAVSPKDIAAVGEWIIDGRPLKAVGRAMGCKEANASRVTTAALAAIRAGLAARGLTAADFT